MNNQAQQYVELLRNNPFVRKFLDLIGWAEGADYNVGFGNRRINSLAWHPYPERAFSINDPVTGRASTTSAAGKYQFQRGTWDRVARQLGLTDFSETSQDIAAIHLISNRGALGDVTNGNITSAVLKLKQEWQGFVTRPLQSIVSKFGTTPETAPPSNAYIPQTPQYQKTAGTFNDYLNPSLISARQRYMLAFIILVIIFVFGFSGK